MTDGIDSGQYGGLSRAQLIALLEKRDRTKKLGLVWERDEIEADHALEAEFIAADLIAEMSDPADGHVGWTNMVIEGDNFDTLRWLRMTMSGRIKCIYVDPPYNTGARDWVYNDHYISKDDRWRHSTWLEFLYRRFYLARDLLTEDGVILVSINDENRARLELLLDEVLPGMRIGSAVWRTRTGSNADQDNFLSNDHEHVLIYGMAGFRFGGTLKSYEMYSNPDGDKNGDWRKDNLTLGFNYKQRPNLYYPLLDPDTGIYYPANPERVWVYASKSRSLTSKTKYMEEWVAQKRIVFPAEPRVEVFETKDALIEAIRYGNVPKSGKTLLLREELPELDFWVGKPIGYSTPAFKRYKKDLRNTNQPLSSWITPKSEKSLTTDGVTEIISGTNEEGTKEVKQIFGERAFNYPKPLSLIKGLIQQSTASDDIVLDFFAGSATTAQAVMALNAEDGGDRRFIMASSTERTDDDRDKNVAQQVTAERIRRLNASDDAAYANLNAPFAYVRMKAMAFEDIDYEFTPAQAWTALEALHGLPFTSFRDGEPWSINEGDEAVLLLVDRMDDTLLATIKALAGRRANAFVYAWAPGQVTAALGDLDIEVRAVRDTLVSRFRA